MGKRRSKMLSERMRARLSSRLSESVLLLLMGCCSWTGVAGHLESMQGNGISVWAY